MLPLRRWFTFEQFHWSKAVWIAAEYEEPIPLAFFIDSRLRSRILRYWAFLVPLVIFFLYSQLVEQIQGKPAFFQLCGTAMVVLAIVLLRDAQLHWLMSQRHDLAKLATRRYRLSFFVQPAKWWTIHREVDQEELVARVLIVGGQSHLVTPRLKA